MLKSLVNKYLKAALDELFIDGGNVSMSMGSDLFSDSSINLSSLTFRSDLFDIYLQPLRLVSGSLGKLSVEGLAELALSMGKVRCQVDQVFLLFEVDDNLDAERVMIMKKLLLELQGPCYTLFTHVTHSSHPPFASTPLLYHTSSRYYNTPSKTPSIIPSNTPLEQTSTSNY